jgi:NAD(P)-dependent dehydrogenase (short-subunit alcohol dehydrogenase family)
MPIEHLFTLNNKVAIVTGGAKGIGKATARMLAQAGAQVEVFDIEEVDGARVDITSEAAVKEALDRVAHARGGIDILVNNAGRVARKPATELPVDEWQQVIDLNLTAMFVCSRRVHPHLKARGGGSIVNLASIMGLSGGLFPNAAYQASKGGVVNLTRALALEWAHDDIRVNAVAPNYVDTELSASIFSNPDRLDTVMQHTPLGRLPTVDDVAAAVLYLCSPAARCVTGVILPVDGGYLAR